jgi:DNA-binding transcriptional regulator GbsR (MarR family)
MTETVESLVRKVIEQNNVIIDKLDQYSSEHQAQQMTDEIKKEIIAKILDSPLNISIIPDALESQIYDCILNVVFKYLPVLR